MKYIIRDYNELESTVNDKLGLTPTKGSGSVHNDGDGKSKGTKELAYMGLLAECKYSQNSKMTLAIRKSDFEKTKKSANRLGRIAVMATFNPDSPDGVEGDILVGLSLSDFQYLYTLATSKGVTDEQ